MPALASVLKDEISRLAKKEIKAQTEVDPFSGPLVGQIKLGTWVLAVG